VVLRHRMEHVKMRSDRCARIGLRRATSAEAEDTDAPHEIRTIPSKYRTNSWPKSTGKEITYAGQLGG
jgi:hypothetical protein